LPADFDLDASTSLGLSIVRTLVESELGGSIDISARAGGGTSVRLVVPWHAGETG
jgi:two-component system, sensor histidine kinase PdtaS